MLPKWNYFDECEVQGLDNELVAKLDQARHVAGVPFRIPKGGGLRTPTTNTDPNAVKNSAHLTGKGADILCSDYRSLWRMLNGLFSAGFKRIGVYMKSDPNKDGRFIPTHIHVDTDEEKPQEVVFLSEEF